MLNLDNELCILEKYKLTPTELFTVKVILLAQEENNKEPLFRFAKVMEGGFRLELERLKSKGIILKTYKIPESGTPFNPLEVDFNKNFIKYFFKASYELGEELFNTYPQFLTINGSVYNARRVSKKYNDLEDAFAKYGKAIKYNLDVHNEIMDNIKWGIDSGYNFTTLDDFIADNAWTALKAFREGNGINVNTEAIKMI